MGNQLAATPSVDLANISSDLERIAPLGAEGRSYFASFHCLYYRLLTNGAAAANSASPGAFGALSADSPAYSTGFYSLDETQRRPEYRPSGVLYIPVNAAGSTRVDSPLSGNRGPAGRGRGGGRAQRIFFADSCSHIPTVFLSAAERALWHHARWQQRLSVASRPWRTIPSAFPVDGNRPSPPPSSAAMEWWYRDSSASVSSLFFTPTHLNRNLSPSNDGQQSVPPAGVPSTLSDLSRSGAEAGGTGVVGEWRGNYGNYVQLLLRGGSGGGSTISAAICHGQVVVTPNTTAALTAASPNTRGAAGMGRTAAEASASSSYPTAVPSQRSYMLEDVVTKVFVRAVDDPGQTYFLKRVHQIMDSVGEQLDVVDSILVATTPRSCLWYSLVYEGDGFCVLQRPYVAFSLRERLASRPSWTAADKLFVTFQILQCVAHLHESYALTHGDIKPNNVLVQSTGFVVLCDMAPFKPWRLPLDSPLLFDYYYDTEESRSCYVAPEKFSDQPLPIPPLESKTRGNATYNVANLNVDGHTAAMDVFSTACVLLYLYREEDPLTLSDVLSLHNEASTEARTKAALKMIQDAAVPEALHPMLLSMLASPSAERPSALELLRTGLADGVFPASFRFLYEDVLPRLLSATSEARLRLLQSQITDILHQCAVLDGKPVSEETGKPLNGFKGENQVTPRIAVTASYSRAVCILLPLLLQTLHSTRTRDEATYRGLLCLRQCVPYVDFVTVTNVILPHLVYLVNDDAHVCGPPTRLLAIRLLCSVAETMACHLTRGHPALASDSDQTSQGSTSMPDEEHWALMEHLVLPCLYDVLRQSEQESTAVLVELAERLPRLLLLTRYLTERRQVLYGAERTAPTTKGNTVTPATTSASHQRKHHQQEGSLTADTAKRLHTRPASDIPSKRTVHSAADEKELRERGGGTARESEEEENCGDATHTRTTSSVTSCATATPLPRRMESDATFSGGANSPVSSSEDTFQSGKSATLAEESGSAVLSANSLRIVHKVPQDEKRRATNSGNKEQASGSSTTGTLQYLAQLHCLLANGWSMLQILYNHPCVPVSVAMLRQSISTVAAFLGEERVTEDLIPLLTTFLTAPVRVLRALFPQAIIVHAILSTPQSKTLRLFVEEGLRQRDEVCLKATLDSMSVVVRSRRLPVEETMMLVHQCLPLLVDGRLWLQEAVCGVVEAAAQSFSPSDVVLHLEYAVRPLLTHPVPLSQLRRFATCVIRTDLAASASSPVARIGLASALAAGSPVSDGTLFPYSSSTVFVDQKAAAALHFKRNDRARGAFAAVENEVEGKEKNISGDANSDGVDFRDVLPCIISATASASSTLTAPTLLHVLPDSTIASPSPMQRTRCGNETNETGANAAVHTDHLNAREAVRAAGERVDVQDGTTSPSLPPPRALTRSSSASPTPAQPLTASAAATPPHVMEVSPLPATLAPHASICRLGSVAPHTTIPSCAMDISSSAPRRTPYAVTSPLPSAHSVAVATATPSLTSAVAVFAAGTVANLPRRYVLPPSTSPISSSCPPLQPTAAPLTASTAHIAAIYTAAAAPVANGIVVTAGALGEAMTWSVAPPSSHMTQVQKMTMLYRVPPMQPVAGNRTGDTYTASQWMDVVTARREGGTDSSLGSSTVTLANSNGAVGMLDVERNVWVWGTHIGQGGEGAVTSLALHDRSSLLISTAAGGVHVVDTRARCAPSASVSDSRASAGTGAFTTSSAAWTTRLDPLDGPPSCLVPLYTGDKACAVVVGTFGGVVCLYDLRFQVCAQRTVLRHHSTDTYTSSSSSVSILSACIDPLSSLCQGCRPSSWEAPLPGPSLLFGTTSGTVYRHQLQSNTFGSYWPAFQCRRDSGGVRCMLAQPASGSVFTGTEDGYIRSWSTDRPESSHTLSCMPFVSPSYTVTHGCDLSSVNHSNGARTGARSGINGGSSGSRVHSQEGTRRLAALTVLEANMDGDRVDCQGASPELPHHAPDAILTLCAVRTPCGSSSSPISRYNGEDHAYLLSGARDGTLTLWSNTE